VQRASKEPVGRIHGQQADPGRAEMFLKNGKRKLQKFKKVRWYRVRHLLPA